MEVWDLKQRGWNPHHPAILCSTPEARAILLDLPAGEMLQEHQVHEGAWIIAVRGELTISNGAGQAAVVRDGTMVRLRPRERHEVVAREDSRLLLLLTPWPGAGHPGAMTLAEKADVRNRAAARRS